MRDNGGETAMSMANDTSKRLPEKILDFYSLADEPFSISPNPRYLYLSPVYQSTIAKLLYSIDGRQGLAMLVGDYGLGKTTIARHIHDLYRDRPDTTVVYMTAPKSKSEYAFLRSISREYGIPMKRSADDQENALKLFFQEEFAEGRYVLLLLDEAQDLNSMQFDIIHSTYNYETPAAKLFQVVLFGSRDIYGKLQGKGALVDRFSVTCHLDPWDAALMRKMLEFRCMVASGEQVRTLFSDDAYEEIFRVSKGRPRAALILCRLSLAIGFANEMRTIPVEIVREAEQDDMFRREVLKGNKR